MSFRINVASSNGTAITIITQDERKAKEAYAKGHKVSMRYRRSRMWWNYIPKVAEA